VTNHHSGRCEEFQRLIQEYASKVLVYSDIMQACLNEQRDAALDEALRDGERARIACDISRLSMEIHVSEHGCRTA
jgi:hypothetical protein